MKSSNKTKAGNSISIQAGNLTLDMTQTNTLEFGKNYFKSKAILMLGTPVGDFFGESCGYKVRPLQLPRVIRGKTDVLSSDKPAKAFQDGVYLVNSSIGPASVNSVKTTATGMTVRRFRVFGL